MSHQGKFLRKKEEKTSILECLVLKNVLISIKYFQHVYLFFCALTSIQSRWFINLCNFYGLGMLVIIIFQQYRQTQGWSDFRRHLVEGICRLYRFRIISETISSQNQFFFFALFYWRICDLFCKNKIRRELMENKI